MRLKPAASIINGGKPNQMRGLISESAGSGADLAHDLLDGWLLRSRAALLHS